MTSIDQRVVQMRFDNKDFERNANSTISVLEKLKEKLTFKESGKALEDFQKNANKLNFDSLEKSTDSLSNTLSTKLIAKLTIVENLVNRVTDAGVSMVKNLAFGQINAGFSKYEEKLSNTQAIMNATGKSLEEVNEQLNKLMWYTDETSYSFTDMSNNIGKFTSNNIDLEVAVKSMMGIANAAGLAGAKTQEASHAMDGFSKAMAKGYMDRQNWQWIQTAHMDTAKFKEELIASAVALGTLEAAPDGLTFWTKTSKPLAVSVTDFATAMKDGWMTTEVMLDTLGKFGNYSDAVYELYQNGMSTADAMDALSGKFDAVGEAGMRASQESKTFADALNAVKDAISSGWMATFETIFGDFEEAKEVWAALYDELYDIFAAGGEARNELLSEWKEAGGRDVFLKTLADGWNEVKKVMGVVKEAFRDIFPETTWIQLLRFTFGLRDFVAQFKLSAEAAYSLKAILKVLLLPIKMVSIGLKSAILALSLFAQAAFKVTDILLSMMASAELTKKVFQKLFGETQGERIFNALAKIIDNVSRSLGDAITKFNEFRRELSTNDTFLGFVENLRQGLKAFGNGFVELLASGLEAIASGDWKKFFKIINNGMKDIGKGAQKSLKFLADFIGKFIDLSKIKLPEFKGFESFEKFFESVKEFIKEINPFKDATTETGEKGKQLAEIIKGITTAVVEFTKKINPAKILLFGFGVTMLELVHNISGFVSSAAKVTSSFAGIGDSAKGVLNALKARLDPNTKKAKDLGDVLIKVAAAIAILAGSLKMLSELNQVRLQITVTVIKDLFITIGAIAGALGLLNIIGAKMKATSDSLDAFAKIMLALTLSALAIAAAVKIMDQTKPDEALIKIGAVMLSLVGLSVAVGLLAKGKNEKNFKIAAATILALAGAVYIMVQAMNKVDPMRAKTGIAAIVVLMGMLDLAFLAMAKTNKESRKAASSALQIAVALEIMAFVVNQLGKMAEQNPERLALGFVVGMIELYGMLLPLLILSRIFGKYMKDATKGYKDLAVAITLLTIPIYILGNMPEGILDKGIGAVKNLGKFFTGMSAMLMIVSGIFAGESSGSLVKGLKDFAIACTLLTLPIYLIGVGMNEEQIKRGIDAIGFLTIFIMGLQTVASRCKVDKDSKVGIMAFMGVLGIFLTAMTILSFVDFNDLIRTAGVMTVAMAALGAAMYGASKIEFKKSLGSLVVAASFIAMVGEVFKATENIQNPYEVLAKFGGIAIALLGFSAAARIMTGENPKSKVNFGVAISKAILMAVFLGEITLFLNSLEATPEPLDMIAKALGLAIVITATANAAEELQNSKIDWDTAVANAGLMFAFVASAAAGLAILNLVNASWDTTIANAAALGLVITALSKAVKMAGTVQIDAKLIDKAALMAAFIAEATLALALLNLASVKTGANWQTSIANAIALSAIVIALSGAAVIMSHTKRDTWKDALGNAASMSLLILAIASSLLIINEVKTEGLLEKVKGMGLILAALIAAVEILGNFKVDPVTVANGLLGVVEVIAVIMAVFLAIDLLDRAFISSGTNLSEILDNVAGIFEKIGSVFGQFVGGIVNGFAVASTRDAESVGEKIALFMGHISTALETVQSFDEGALTAFSNMQQCMDMMLDIIVTPGIGNSSILNDFGQNLVLFGFKAHAFLNTMSNAEDASAAVASIKSMAEVADLLKTGPFEELPDLTAFGEQLRSFAPYMNNFLIAVSSSGINASTVTAATSAAKTMAEFAISLSADGVPEAMRLYSGDGQGILTKFGTELSAFAPSIVDYANTVSGVTDWASVEKSAAAATLVAEFAKKLPKEGGILQYWIGENKTLSSFGQELADFAPKFRAYSLIMSAVSDWDSVTKSATAAVKVANLYSELPSTGGVWQDFFGEKKSLTAFGQELMNFAPKFRAYSLIMKEVDSDTVKSATESVKNVATIYSELPTTGGWMEAIIGGTMDLSTFSTHLSNLGKALDEYYANIQYIDFDRFNNSLTATSLVIDLSNELSNFNGTNVAKFTNAITDLANEGIQEFYNEFINQRTIIENAGGVLIGYFNTGMQAKKYLMGDIGLEFVTEFTASVQSKSAIFELEGAGLNIASVLADAVASADVFKGMANKILNYIGDGLYSKSADLKNKIKALLGEILRTFNEFNDNNDKYSNVYLGIGEKMFIALIVAFSNRSKEITDAVNKVLSTFQTQFKKKDKEWRKIGQYLIQGIAKGMTEDKSAEKAAEKVVNNILKKMQKASKINSPSKETEDEVGYWLSEGVAVGVEKNKHPEEAAENKMNSVLEVFESEGPGNKKFGFLNDVSEHLAEAIANMPIKSYYDKGKEIGTAIRDGMKSVKMGDALEFIGDALSNPVKSLSKPLSFLIANTSKKLRNEQVSIAKSSEHASKMIDLYNDYTSGKRNQSELDKTPNSNVTYQIRKAQEAAGAYKFVDEFVKEWDDLRSLNTIHENATAAAEHKLAQLTHMIELQTDTVNKAEQDYISALSKYGNTSEKTASSFANWAYEDHKLKEYKKEFEETRKQIANDSKADLTATMAEFISMVAEPAAMLKLMVKDDSNELLNFFNALQEDIADGILTNDVVLDAVRERLSEIMDVFDEMVTLSNLNQSLEDKQYELWEKTVGMDATEAEKFEKKMELLDKKAQSAAEAVAIQERKYQEVIGLYGASSKEAKEIEADLYDAQIELADIANEMQETEYEYQKSQWNASQEAKKAAKAAQEAAEEEEKATDKLKTAREKAEEEFEEWRKDGSLATWYEYGATDEELMDALLKKYKDDEAKDTSRSSKKDEDEETFEEFKASGARAVSDFNKYYNLADRDKIEEQYQNGMTALLTNWYKEYVDEAKEMNEQLKANEASGSGGSGGSSKPEQYDSSEIKALAKYRNRYTGEEYEEWLTREQVWRMGEMARAGWDLINELDWDQGRANYEATINLEWSNPKGTYDASKNPAEKLASERAKAAWERENGSWKEGLHPSELIDSTALSQYDGAPSLNTLTKYMCVVRDPDGKAIVIWTHELQDMIARGYTYIEDSKKYNYVKDYTGYSSDDKSDILAEGNDWWGGLVQQQYEDNLENDVSESTEKAVTKGVQSGVNNAAANLSSGGGSGLDIDVSAIEQAAAEEAENMFKPEEGTLAWNLMNIADAGNAGLDNVWNKIRNGIKTGSSYVKKYTDIDLPEAPETKEEAISAGKDIVNQGVQTFSGFFEELYDSAPPLAEASAIESMNAFTTAAGEQLKVNSGDDGWMAVAFEQSGNAVGTIFGKAMSDKMLELADDAINSIWSKFNTAIQNGLAKTSGSSNTYSISPVFDMDRINPTDSKTYAALTASTSIKKADSVTKQIQDNKKPAETVKQETTSNVTNNYFTQNNTSPKSLSRYDIYRDTANLLSRLKGAITK